MHSSHSHTRLLVLLAATLLPLAGALAKPVTAERIIAADREPQNWLAHGRTYDEQRYSPLDQINAGNVGKLGLAWSYATGTDARAAGDADRRRWPDVHDRRLERGVRTRREDRQAALDLRSRGAPCVGSQCLLRRRESRRGGVAGRRLRRHARWSPGVARCAHGQEALGSEHHRPHQAVHDHGRAARREGQGADRQWRRRVWRARLLFRLRRRHRQAGLAFLHGSRQPERRLRDAPRWRLPPRRGPANGGSVVAAARCGTRWLTTRSSTRCTSARATVRRGRARSARRAAATTSTCRPSLRSTRTTGT